MSDQVTLLPKELKKIVGKCVSLLGEVIKEEGGRDLFQKVERIRKKMISYRTASFDNKKLLLDQVFKQIEGQTQDNQELIAHSFSLMLELINACETGYRTFRLSESKKGKRSRQENAMVYVLTAHPTEARTPHSIELFRRVQALVVRILDNSGEEGYLLSLIKHNLKLSWHLPVTRHEKPKVRDEAEHIFSIILRPDIFDTILRSDRDLGKVRIRTWVGGDKDGHPGVDEKVMIDCFHVSRKFFIQTLQRVLGQLQVDINILNQESLAIELKSALDCLKNLKQLGRNDYKNILALKKKLSSLDAKYLKVVGDRSPRLRKIELVFDLFPALVIPIELREDAEIVALALKEKSQAIYRMLSKLKEISNGGQISSYAKGLILSMCHSSEDIQNGMALVKNVFGSYELPVVPLFETAQALEDSENIVGSLFKDRSVLKTIQSMWNNQFEIMLGYSDSSKGMGVLPSRLGIARAMRCLDVMISNAGVTPVFFHGSGGSVDRGGGSLKDQTAWWPKNALNIYKATIQGEMVERNFTSPEVTMSGVNKVLENFNRAKTKKGIIKVDRAVESFSELVKAEYVKKIKDPTFFELIEKATPYSYLKVLKLGSRPAKREKNKTLDLNSIRAIPWILCWTQTRILFPTWWGIGSAWKELKKDEAAVEKLQKSFGRSYLFSSYVRVLAFTLSKVELPVFEEESIG